MHIIFVSNKMSAARTVTLTPRLIVLGMSGLLALIVLLSGLFSYLTLTVGGGELPFLGRVGPAASRLEQGLTTQSVAPPVSTNYVRDNIMDMATKLGEMQAQLIRLDGMGERLATLAGVKPQEIKKLQARPDGRGGPLVNTQNMSSDQLQIALDALSRDVDARTDKLALIETELFEKRVKQLNMPTSVPVDVAWNASSFGWRIDPFDGSRAMHEGVDFSADVGTPIHAAATGRVLRAERHPEYGNLIEIDHGNDMTTRYAHLSKMLVKEGDLVQRGKLIAEVGSTGRSTGPHLHFEVRFNGIAQNPNRFLEYAQQSGAKQVVAGR